ncbi:MAG: amidohydrolase family protein [Rhodospirillaceae bacterium]|jgi:predicted TIM-barrel fold metal-dependent hydrolase|nr:amidohydrolase family protein [Rhodospirillaceae bacterium]MBT4588526.1 amidohydrolase family protein [Rhodospirillaceae bacterium]MBT4938301.1 amidohydrolase family protein [Rhodospirillaceae bacterium]MBT5938544.1 amidohydrolase family protein [Rhodospirillaceae bacterium]MBT7268166.1 amidohydrolase family protein [Rhodospirillaceae bacterium]
MSGFAAFPGRDVRAKVDHPVIDCDAHVVESPFAVLDFLKQILGNDAADKLAKTRWALRQYNQPSKFLWWGVPSGPHTADRALAMLPNYFYSQMDEMGMDFAHFYTTTGIPGLYIQDDEMRPAYCRALNMLYADMFKDVGDRMRPVAVIPTFTPEEAITELEFAVNELGHKAIMVGTEVMRPVEGAGPEAPFKTGSIAIDPHRDYDPFWQKCVDLKVAPVGHTAAIGNAYRNSPSNYVFNHLGSFGVGGEYFARALFLGGVTKRFPELSFGFLEGGAAWALNLLNDIVEHFEKRNVENLELNLDPNKVDADLLGELFDQYGNEYLTGDRIREAPNGALSKLDRPDLFNEFEACGMTEIRDLGELFVEPFYFGCEADDRMTAVAFNRRLNPLGKPLKAVFGSDIGHWDVMDAKSILSEAWSLVDAKLITRDDFRDLTFTNPAMLHLSVNPDYFAGTVIEDDAKKLLAAQA